MVQGVLGRQCGVTGNYACEADEGAPSLGLRAVASPCILSCCNRICTAGAVVSQSAEPIERWINTKAEASTSAGAEARIIHRQRKPPRHHGRRQRDDGARVPFVSTP